MKKTRKKILKKKALGSKTKLSARSKGASRSKKSSRKFAFGKTSARLSEDIAKFKRLMGKKIKNINWSRLGAYALTLLVLAAATGLFGPKAQMAALAIVKNALWA